MELSPGWTLEVASKIGERLLAEAVDSGIGVTWYAYERVPGSRPYRTKPRLQGSSIYRGSAGVSLFLSELGYLSGREDFVELAARAVRHALDEWKSQIEPRLSLYSGEVGTLFALACHLRHVDDPGLRTAGEELVEDLIETHRETGSDFDLIGGIAGAIVGLLGVSDVFDPDSLLFLCIRLGEHLISGAEVEAVGLSWPSGMARGGNLCGLGHGAAGIGWALLELSRHTGRDSFRIAAEEAFAYEGLWFNEEVANWADLRNSEMAEFQFEGRMEDLDSLVRAGGPIPLYQPKYMSAWCHGAPGIGLSRARAYQVLGREDYRSQTLAAAKATVDTLEPRIVNHSLCHGFLGNAVARLYIAQTLGLAEMEQETLHLVEDHVGEIVRRGARWIPGGPDREHWDPTLLLGEAGIGLALLGLEHEMVSPLFPIPPDPSPDWVSPEVDDGQEVIEKVFLRAFPSTADALRSSTRVLESACESENRSKPRAPVTSRLEETLREWIPKNAEVPELSFALRGDTLALRRGRSGFDRSHFVLLRRFRLHEVGEDDSVALAPWVEIIQEGDGHWLLYPDETCTWRANVLSPELLALLEECQTPTNPNITARRLAEASGCDHGELRFWVQAQMEALAKAGILVPRVLAVALRNTGERRKTNAEMKIVHSRG